METKTPDVSRAAPRADEAKAARPAPRPPRPRAPAALALVVAALAIPLVARVAIGAGYQAGGPITVKGKTVGSGKLLNPVWNEAKDPSLHRFTFREPSATVRPDVRTLTAFLPKELCVAALVPGDGKALNAAYRVVVAGGRTSPVTLVVAPGQQLQFENQDPFPHKLYVVGADSKGFAATETAGGKSRTWTPPGPGKYEIRDQAAPSVRSWIVVEPHVVSVGYPDRKGDFQIDLQPGTYTLRGYFNGEPVGSELPVTVALGPVEQPLRAPLVVGDDGPAPGSPGGGAPAPSTSASAGKPPQYNKRGGGG
jgi:plastocyanin